VIQFLVFYSIWVVLWAPNVIVYQLTSGESDLTNIVALLNFIEISLDPIIIGALDVRFWKAWRQLWLRLKNIYFRGLHRQVMPATIVPTLPRVKKQNETAF
jgi:hypothetical protein